MMIRKELTKVHGTRLRGSPQSITPKSPITMHAECQGPQGSLKVNAYLIIQYLKYLKYMKGGEPIHFRNQSPSSETNKYKTIPSCNNKTRNIRKTGRDGA